MKKIAAILVAGGLLGGALPAMADETYRGVMQISVNGQAATMNNTSVVREVAVILTLKERPKLGELGGKIRFADPWVCGFELSYSGQQYAFKGAGVGKCRSLEGGYLSSERAGDELKISIHDTDDKLLTAFELEKDSSK